ncbi:MAG: hypothetical protein GC159_16590 [Phycisphaera sp.]|nr:hypothetical protein [Phycisphaera sp.]
MGVFKESDLRPEGASQGASSQSLFDTSDDVIEELEVEPAYAPAPVDAGGASDDDPASALSDAVAGMGPDLHAKAAVVRKERQENERSKGAAWGGFFLMYIIIKVILVAIRSSGH